MMFQKKSKSIGLSYVILSFVLFVVCSAMLLVKDVGLYKGNEFLFCVAFSVLLFVAIIFILRGVVLVKLGSSWRLELNENRLIYCAPKPLSEWFFKNDSSFDVLLSEIESVMYDPGHNKVCDDIYSEKCVIILFSGVQFEISSESGINLSSLINEIRSHGVFVNDPGMPE
jgi:hypothetical protein